MTDIIDHFECKNYLKEGAVGALAFTTIMNLGGGPNMMKGVLGIAAAAAMANPFINPTNRDGTEKSAKQKAVETVATAAVTWRIWEGFSRASEMAKDCIAEGLLDLIHKHPTTKPEYVLVKYLNNSSTKARYNPYFNEIQFLQEHEHSSNAVHEWVHARWRNLRVALFGARAQINYIAYYQLSDPFFTINRALNLNPAHLPAIPRLSWFNSGVEAFVESVTVLKAPLKWSTRKVGFGGSLANLLILDLAIFLVTALPLAYLMQQAADTMGWKVSDVWKPKAKIFADT